VFCVCARARARVCVPVCVPVCAPVYESVCVCVQGIANVLWASAMLSVPDEDDDDETVARAAALRQRLSSVAASLCPRAVAQVGRLGAPVSWEARRRDVGVRGM
jgi:hypothetical protein